jgi:hypothetical protein
MIPTQPWRGAPESERRVFARFAQALPDMWVVFHARRFVVPAEPGGRAEEGEIDFLVLDPARGLLALEAKGGALRRGPDGWLSLGRGGVRHPIQDPGRQASQAIHALDRWLQRAPGFAGRFGRVPFGWGVVLPDVDVSSGLGPDLPRELVIDRTGLLAPRSALERVYAAHGLAGPPLAAGAVRSLVDALAPRLDLQLAPQAQARFSGRKPAGRPALRGGEA